MKEDSDPNIDPEYASSAYDNNPEELYLACNWHLPQANTITSASNTNIVNIASSLTFNTTHDNDENQASVQEEFRANTMSFFTNTGPWTYGTLPANYSSAVPTNAYSSNTYDGSPNFITEPYVSYYKHSDTNYFNSDLYTSISKYSSNWTRMCVAGAHQPSQGDNQQCLHGPQMLYKSNHQLSNIQIDQQVLRQPSATVFAGSIVSTSDHDTCYQSSFNDVISPPSYSSQNAPNCEWNKYEAHQNMFSLGPPLQQDCSQLHSYVNQEELLPHSSLHIPYKSQLIQNHKYEDSVLNHEKSICTEETQCSPKSSTQSRIQKHVQSHTGEKLFQCDICKKQFSTSKTMREHKWTHTEKNLYQCDLCPGKFLYQSLFEIHRRIHTGERPYQCDLCPKKFSRQEYLKNHKFSHTGERPYQCDLCPKKFSRQDYLKNHIKFSHTGERLYQCDLCPMKFLYSSNLKNHKRTHTGEKPYQCDLCTMKFSYSSNLKRHRWTHTGEKPYQCNLCPKKFSRSNDLKIHCRTHIGEKLYQCNLCQMKFSYSSNLKNHRRTHTGEKPYECDLCPKKFSRSEQLKIHKFSHTGEKPYECDLCTKTFSYPSHLKKHKRTHTGEKPYECDICSRKFSISNRLKIHRQTHAI